MSHDTTTPPDHGDGLHEDLVRMASRRDALKVFGAGGTAAILTGLAPAQALAKKPTAKVPTETAGPYPGDGSNGPNVLTQSGIVRQDIRSSFGSSTTTATGVPLTIELTVVDSTNDGAPLAGAAVYAWHCDQQGRYSMYSQGVTNENYLRGVQVADADGKLSFTSIFPACYSGRWPHIHFEVYPDRKSITDASKAIATSQAALPRKVCRRVYGQPGYEQSVSNLAQVSLASDNVFGDDGGAGQLATVRGNVRKGYSVRLAVGVDTTTKRIGGQAPAGGGPGGPPPGFPAP